MAPPENDFSTYQNSRQYSPMETTVQTNGGPLLTEMIKLNYDAEWKLVEQVFQLISEKLSPMAQARSDLKVLDFRQPSELKVHLHDVISLEKCNAKPDEMQQSAWCARILDICQKIVDNSVKTGNKQFMQQLFGGMDPYGFAAAVLIEAMNTSTYTYEVGPVVSLIENELISFLGKLVGWKCACDGIFCPGGSMANFYGISLARHKMCPDTKKTGVFGHQRVAIFCSDQAHYSIEKAAAFMGLGTDSVHSVLTDSSGRMTGQNLSQAVIESKNAGRVPMLIVATMGTTVLCGFDDLNACAAVAKECGMWLHVDACLGGGLLFSYNHRLQYFAGIEQADSIAWCWHKTLGAPFQTSLILVKERGLLSAAHGSSASYLFQSDKHYDTSYDTGDKSVQCGRRPDALKPWLMLKSRGMAQIGHLIDSALKNATLMTEHLKEHPLVFEVLLTQCFAVSFWIKPKSARQSSKTIAEMCTEPGEPENQTHLKNMHKMAPKFKMQMVKSGGCMLAFQSIASKNLVNFFRVTFKCHPLLSEADIKKLVDDLLVIADSVDA